MTNNGSTTFSVIVPTYKEEAFLAKTLSRITESIDKSSFNCEIIVVDGGSNDNTADIAKNFTEKVYVLDKRGIGLARNYGVRKSKHNVLAFIDADVIIPENFFTQLGNIFEANNIAGANCDVRPLSRISPTYFENAFYFLWGRIKSATYHIKACGTGENGIFVRKPVFEKVNGFDESLPTLEDFDFVFRASQIGKFIYIKDLKIYDTLRRFRKLGALKFSREYLSNFIYYSLFKETKIKEWEPVR